MSNGGVTITAGTCMTSCSLPIIGGTSYGVSIGQGYNTPPKASVPPLKESDRLTIAFIVEQARTKVAEFRRTLDIWLAANRERIERLGAIRIALQDPTHEKIRSLIQLDYCDPSIGWHSSSFYLFGHVGRTASIGKPTFFVNGEVVDNSEQFAIECIQVERTVQAIIAELDERLVHLEKKLAFVTTA